MSVATTLLAINWSPELRGILIVIIAVAVLMGGVYMILATNLGARLGFLVALAGLAGWMLLMGIMWSVYGIGLRGKDPTWDAVPGRTVLQDVGALYTAGVLDQRLDIPPDTPFPEQADARAAAVPGGGLDAAVGVRHPVRPGVVGGGDVPRGDQDVRRRRVQGRQRLRHRRRAVPEDRRLRPVRLLPQAAPRRRRGGAAGDARAPSRAAPRRRPRSTRRASTSTSTWSATSAPGANRPSS